jgi:ATP-binding cassette subfamily B protein
MSDYSLEEEKVVTGFDRQIVKRLLQQLKPYRIVVALALLALAVATAAELAIPVLIQQTVDRHLITKYVRVSQQDADLPALDRANLSDTPRVGDYHYILESRLTFLSGSDRSELESRGVLSDDVYYVFERGEETNRVISQHPPLFLTGEGHAAIPWEGLDSLTNEEVRTIKAAEFRGIARNTAIFLALLGAALVSSFAQVYLLAYAGQGVMKDLRVRLFDHLLHQSLRFLNDRPVGKLVTRITNDVETINELFTQVLANILKNIAMMAGVVVTLYIVDPLLATVAMATLPPVIILTLLFRKRARDAFRNVRTWISRLNSFLAEHISGISVVQTFVRELRTDQRFEERNRSHMRASLGEMYVFATFRPIMDLLSSASVACIIYFGAFFLISGLVSLGVLIAFVELIRRFYRQLMEISERFVIVQSALAGSERVFSLLDEDDRIPDTGTKALPPETAGKVEFDSVWFSYKENEPVIKDLSFTVEPGETVALVGYTGAGKTTIANLLTRIWDIESGSIRIDGTDIREFSLSSLRRTIQPIQQDVFLFRDTVEENIRLGEETGRERAVEAAQAVQADRFIQRLPAAYRSELQEGAANISTGQRQLISFARVLAHDPRIIVLDEATSSIDTETERLIQDALQVLLRGRTSLVIAHRLSTIQHADRILVLSGGRLVEQGTHTELLRAQGVYYNLYKLQYSDGHAG